MAELTAEERLRYGRHLVMPEVSLAGQERLKAARVLCVGAGGLGSPIALYLAAAGVGTIGLVDDDVVELSNIQRQVLYATQEVGTPKVEAAQARLAALNPDITLETHAVRLSSDNVLDLVDRYDLVIDGSDNFPTRYLVNDACVLAGKPNVYGSVFRFEGQVSVFDPARGPCYRCLFPEPPPPGTVPSCAEAGVLGVLPGIVGSLQGLEALKLILGKGDALVGRLLLFDGLAMRFREISVARNPACPVCGDSPSITGPIDYDAFCGVESSPVAVPAVSVVDLRAELAAAAPPRLLDVRNPPEWAVARLPGALEIPLPELEARCQELDPADHYVLTCQKGPRALKAYALLQDKGFRSLRVLQGGMDAWTAAGAGSG